MTNPTAQMAMEHLKDLTRREVHINVEEESRGLKEQLGDRKPRLSDDTRRRLAVLGKEWGRKVLSEVATIATPETAPSFVANDSVDPLMAPDAVPRY